ncbi:MAG TPA: hypothetical protein VK990_06950, partial [Acidimicrobiia bacterium]|nr:hypothetical protein [Acidimicrobiia bacterium]
MRKRWLIATITALALIVAACGGGAEDTTTTEATGSTEAPATTQAGDTGTTAEAAEATGYDHLDQALAGEFDGSTVEVWAQWLPESSEASNFTYTLEPFQEATRITVNFQPTPDYETALQVAVDGGN